MDFDREYNRHRQPKELDDFTDLNVQALIEGRRKKALPRPNVEKQPVRWALADRDGYHYDRTARATATILGGGTDGAR